MENRLTSPTTPSFLQPILTELDLVQKLIFSELKDCQPEVFDIIQRAIFTGGKRIRPAIVLLVGKALQGPEEELKRLAASIELLHDATLIHDDLIDQANMRHHQPTVHTTFSSQMTVLIGDYLFAHAAKMAAEINSREAAKIFASALITIVNGEIIQNSNGGFTPDQLLYEKRIYQKTASLFESSAQIAAHMSSSDTEIIRAMQQFGYHIGMAFQMTDDVLDVIGDEKILGKPVGTDLRQGILNLPTMIYLQDHPDSPFAISILSGSCSKDIETGKLLLEAVKKSSAIDKARIQINHHLHAGKNKLVALPESNYRQQLMEMISYLSQRIR